MLTRRKLLAKLGIGAAGATALAEMARKDASAGSCHYEYITVWVDQCHSHDDLYRVCYQYPVGWSYSKVQVGPWYCTCPYPKPCG